MKTAGIGFRDEATLVAVLDALARAGGVGVTRIALPERKRGHALCAALESRGFMLVFIPDAALAATATPTQSPIAQRHYGTGSVAEAAALAALPGARLAAPRVLSADRMATAAIAFTGDPA